MKGFDLFFIPKPFGNSTSWQAVLGFRDPKTPPTYWGVPYCLLPEKMSERDFPRV
jgi:hypothetical protein